MPQRLSQFSRPIWASVLLAITLVVLGLMNLRQGFDAFELVTGDALYSVQMLDFGLLDFRPPPPNRLFPDVAAHWLASWFLTDPYQQKLAVGIGLFSLCVLYAGFFRGLAAMALFSAIMVSNGFEFLVSATHYSLPILVLAFVALRSGRWELPALFAVVFFNPLVLLPLAFVLVEPDAARRHLVRGGIVFGALALNTAWSEFSATLIQIVVFFPFWYAAAWLARRLGVIRLGMAALCILLPLAAMVGLAPARYTVPVAASILLLMFPPRRPAFDWRYVAFPVAATAIFFVTVDRTRLDRLAASYDCLATELAERGIDTIAAGHWTAKPLYFAAKQAGLPLTITQTDFARNASHPWMAPYTFYGEPTPYAVRDTDTCTMIDPSATYCGQASMAEVAEVTPLCGIFELYRYETAVPANHTSRPAGKLEAIRHNLDHYVSVVVSRLR